MKDIMDKTINAINSWLLLSIRIESNSKGKLLAYQLMIISILICIYIEINRNILNGPKAKLDLFHRIKFNLEVIGLMRINTLLFIEDLTINPIIYISS